MEHVTAYGGGAMGTAYVQQNGVSVKVALSGTPTNPPVWTAPLPTTFPFPLDELYLNRGAQYTLPAGATWNITYAIGGNGVFNNNGTVHMAGQPNSTLSVAFFNNNGTISMAGSNVFIGANMKNSNTGNNAFLFPNVRNLTLGSGARLNLPQSPNTGRYGPTTCPPSPAKGNKSSRERGL
jgi:hypothetical protein